MANAAFAVIDTSTNPDLFLTLVDQSTAKMSYTLNLNVKAADFWINAQQEEGSFLFFTVDPSTDTSLQTFLAAADLNTTRWAVLGFTNLPSDATAKVLYSTLTNNGDQATQTASYNALFAVSNSTLRTNGTVSGYLNALNNAVVGSTILASTLNSSATFGSSLSTSTYSTTYAAKGAGFTAPASVNADGTCLVSGSICVGNPIGKSSWFYKTKQSSTSNLAKVAVDEFDNNTNDGYWGFVKDSNSSKYILSYTLPGSNPHSLVSTDAGRSRLSFTDYSAFSGAARLITIGDNDVANAGLQVAAFAGNNVSAVPEPQSWSLMALGGLLLAARLRRERRAAGH